MISNYLKTIDDVIEKGAYKDDWTSLAQYPIPQWYKDAKFGMFIHWGVYSVPAFSSEWYSRMMYYRGNHVNLFHRMKYGKDFNYHDFIPMFKAEKFDAMKWAEIIRDSGAKFMMPVAEHHDGFKLYDSEMSKWTSVNMGPKRDVLGELKKACDKTGLIFSTSSHRAENFWFFNGGRTLPYENATQDDAYKGLYGETTIVHDGNNLVDMLKQEDGIRPTKEWLENWIVSSCELIDRYQPASLFFDWWVSQHDFRPYMKKFLAYYYNRSLEWGKEVGVYYKSDGVMYNAAIFDRERGQLDSISPYTWQGETATSRIAWSHVRPNVYKPTAEIACNMLDVISKNGCYVLNIGPKANGSICNEEMEILRKMGTWTKRNDEAIWGTGPYKVFGEGKKQKSGSFSERYNYTEKDYRFTYKPGTIYAFALVPQNKKVFRIKTFAHSMDGFNFVIKNVSLLGDDTFVKVTPKKDFLELELQKPVTEDMPICFKFDVD